MQKNIHLLAWFNFFTDFRLYGPVAILYFAHVTGSFALGMSVFSITMLSAAVMEVPTGILSDRIGRKHTVTAGAIASVLAVTFYAVGGAYLALVVGACFEGLARSFYSGNNQALLYDTLAETDSQAEYQAFLGKTSAMYQAALAISAVVGSVLAAINYSLVMWLSVIPQVLALIVSLRFINPPRHASESANVYAHLRDAVRNWRNNRRLRALSAANVIGYAVGESAFQFRAAFIETLWPLWAIGFARMISNVMATISFYLSGKLIKRFGELRLLTVGISYSEIANIGSLLVPTVLSPIWMGSTSIFFGVNTIAIDGLMQREFSSEQRATMGSLVSFAGSLGFAVFAVVLGWLADQIGVISALLLAESIVVLTILLYRQAFKHPESAPAVGAMEE